MQHWWSRINIVRAIIFLLGENIQDGHLLVLLTCILNSKILTFIKNYKYAYISRKTKEKKLII